MIPHSSFLDCPGYAMYGRIWLGQSTLAKFKHNYGYLTAKLNTSVALRLFTKAKAKLNSTLQR